MTAKMGWPYSKKKGGNEDFIPSWFLNRRGRDRWEDQDVLVMTILKQNIKYVL